MIGYVELATTILLFIAFLAAEIYRLRSPDRGRIVECESIAGGLGGYRAKVRLYSGELVEVYISPCVACAGKLSCGSEVIVHRTRQGLVASTPLACSRKG